ncbi:MAG: hypothetical protein JWO36_2665 [Myxococcales bacterium]|nr:hypothetical protein [Myxococcales bacterium]
MHRLALFAVAAIVFALVVATANADLENQGTDSPKLYTSKPDRLRLVVPRGWRATDQASYPGLLLWMMRSQPEGKIVLSAETFTHELYCSWPIACRSSHESLASKFACALQKQLQTQRMRVADHSIQAGPKENEEAGIPSVWFEYDDGKHYFRQALAVTEDRVVSLVLGAPTVDARSQHVRAFEQVLRTLRPLTAEELGTHDNAPTPEVPGDGGVLSGAQLPTGSGAFESAPAPKINPVGPCAK